MLEAWIIWHFSHSAADTAEEKGYSREPFAALFIILWVLGEAVGFVLGLSLTEGVKAFVLAYLVGLIVAMGGGFLAFAITVFLPSRKGNRNDELDPRRQPRRRRGQRLRTQSPRRPDVIVAEVYTAELHEDELEVLGDHPEGYELPEVRPAPRPRPRTSRPGAWRPSY